MSISFVKFGSVGQTEKDRFYHVIFSCLYCFHFTDHSIKNKQTIIKKVVSFNSKFYSSHQKPSVHIKQLLPVQTVDHVSHGVDEILVFLGVTDNDAVELLHVGVNGVKGGCLSASCMRATQHKP